MTSHEMLSLSWLEEKFHFKNIFFFSKSPLTINDYRFSRPLWVNTVYDKKKAPCFIQCLFVLDDLSPMTLSFQDLYRLTLFIIKNNKAPCFIPCIFVFGNL